MAWSAAKSRAGGQRGRPLDPSLDEVIRAATAEVLAEVGYEGLTMEAVAVAAGVSKASIYRRWRSKTELLVSVIDQASDDSLVPPDTGSLRGDLIALLTALAEVLAGPGGSASRALLSAATAEPALAAAFRQGPMGAGAGRSRRPSSEQWPAARCRRDRVRRWPRKRGRAFSSGGGSSPARTSARTRPSPSSMT